MSRVFAGRPIGLALVLLIAAVSFAQSTPAPAPPATPATPAQTPATPVAPTPQPPTPPAKAKKKKKVDAPVQPPPAGEMFAVTIKTSSFGGPAGGIVSPAQIRINSASGPGGSVTGETDYSGEFHTKLAAGDYNLMVEYGSSVAAQQTIHVSKASNNLFQVNVPPRGPGV